MRDILDQIVKWWDEGEPFGLATVVQTFSSAPREAGAAMAVSSSGDVVGSVSGGCVEGAVYDLAGEVMASGQPILQRYGISDDTAFSVGLTCGGIIDIFIEPVGKQRYAELGEVAATIRRSEPVAVATVVAGPGQVGARRVIWPAGEGGAGGRGTPSEPDGRGVVWTEERGTSDEGRRRLRAPGRGASEVTPSEPDGRGVVWTEERGTSDEGRRRLRAPGRGASEVTPSEPEGLGTLGSGDRLDQAVDDDARGMLAQGLTGVRRYGPDGERRRDELSVFVQSFAPPPRMLVFGAIDFAAAVARIGKFLGYRVTVCDARPVFATASRFPEADEVVTDWPHRYLAGISTDERTVICVLTHDPKFDVPVLEVALRVPAAYVGAMGSRRTHEDRLERLREAGLSSAELAKLRSPIGLDLGARTPEETAVAIAAELIQLRWGGSGQALSLTDGRIHHG